MGQPLFCTPNYLKSTFFTPVLGGGNWDPDNWLDFIQDKFFIRQAISTDATVDSTKFQVDLGVTRDIKTFVIPDSNIDQDGKIRIKGSSTIKWQGVAVNGAKLVGSSLLDIISNDVAVTIEAGDLFTIAGHTVTYEVVTGVSLGIGGTGSIGIRQTRQKGLGLEIATTGSEEITCHTGDYTGGNLLIDTDFVDYQKVIYGLIDPWGAPTIWTGKETEENFATLDLPNQFFFIFDEIILGRYWEIEIDNPTNDDGFISIVDCFLASAYIPSTGIGLGAVQGLNSNTTRESSAGGVDVFDIERSGRFLDITLPGVPIEEAVISVYDAQKRLDIHDDFFFIFDDEDLIIANRRSFVARFQELSQQQFQFYDWTNTRMRIVEKIG